MSRPRYRWWSFARRMIRDYPGLKKQMDELHSQSITADISGMPRGSGGGRTVESIAFRQLDPDDQIVFDAVTKAIEHTKLRPDGKERMDFIRYVYWYKKQHTLKNAALQSYISESTAKRWHRDFVCLVGKCYGFHVVDTNKPKKCSNIVESESK